MNHGEILTRISLYSYIKEVRMTFSLTSSLVVRHLPTCISCLILSSSGSGLIILAIIPHFSSQKNFITHVPWHQRAPVVYWLFHSRAHITDSLVPQVPRHLSSEVLPLAAQTISSQIPRATSSWYHSISRDGSLDFPQVPTPFPISRVSSTKCLCSMPIPDSTYSNMSHSANPMTWASGFARPLPCAAKPGWIPEQSRKSNRLPLWCEQVGWHVLSSKFQIRSPGLFG